MTFAPVAVDALTEQSQLFRCEPYRVTLMARACVLRQRAMRQDRTKQGDGLRKGPRPEYDKCVACPLGAEVDAKVGATVTEAPPSHGGIFTLGRRAKTAFIRKKDPAPAPLPAEPPKTPTCSWCGLTGHRSKSCPAKDDARAMEAMRSPPVETPKPIAPAEEPVTVICSVCKKPGHNARTCEVRAEVAAFVKAEAKPARRKQGPRKCSRCGSLEHDLRNCKAPLRPRVRKPIGRKQNEWPRSKAAQGGRPSRRVTEPSAAGRPVKGEAKLDVQLSVRFDPQDVERLDALAEAARRRAFGLTVTRLDALRLAMIRGLDSLEAEIEERA